MHLPAANVRFTSHSAAPGMLKNFVHFGKTTCHILLGILYEESTSLRKAQVKQVRMTTKAVGAAASAAAAAAAAEAAVTATMMKDRNELKQLISTCAIPIK